MNAKSVKNIIISLSCILLSMYFIVKATMYPGICIAAPAAPIISEITQPDGTKFKARNRGDEWNNWTETDTGYTIIKDQETGWWYYAVKDEGNGIKMGTNPVGKIDPQDFSLTKGLLPKMKEHPNQLPPRRQLDNQQ